MTWAGLHSHHLTRAARLTN